jgi:transcriptional regulator with XRE-family HTH domain
MIYPFQIRAARVLLGLSQEQLAKRSGVGLATLKRIEAAGQELTGTVQTMSRIQRALEVAGIIFIDQSAEHGPGLLLRKRLPD